MESILQTIQAGGNLALVAIAVAIYRMDMRLVRLETKLQLHMKEED